MAKPDRPKITLKKLTLENFKNFQHAELELGPLTLLIGANATGKSNIREAFRFLHGIGRGYTISDIVGEKYLAGGERVWQGIKGGIKELPFNLNLPFQVSLHFQYLENEQIHNGIYSFAVFTEGVPGIDQEYLYENGHAIFEFNLPYFNYRGQKTSTHAVSPPKPMLARFSTNEEYQEDVAQNLLTTLRSMRFFSFEPDKLRLPSFPGQMVLGDSGENLSSILYAICEDKLKKESLLFWLQELTPMDVVDLEFPTDQIGRILVTLIEQNGKHISAYSASDGTLRLLGMLAAFLGPESSQIHFFEEPENGIHPVRLYLLTQLLESHAENGNFQIIVTTHSPLLMNYFSKESLEHASLLYRVEGQDSAQIKRIMDIPDARQLIEEQGIMTLHESNWFENVMYFLSDDEDTLEVEAVP